MKNIILIFTVVLSCFLTSCKENEEDPQMDDFARHYDDWLLDYQAERVKLKNLKEVTELRQKTEALWNTYQDSARNIVTQKEIVYIKRMASSSVMNSPAFYEKHYFGNTISENGQGAENEDFTVFYLSDGHIIKASPKENPEWLGTTVGEKALKITGKRLTPTIEEKNYVDADGSCFSFFGSYSWTEEREIKTTTAFEYVNYITYQPLYSR